MDSYEFDRLKKLVAKDKGMFEKKEEQTLIRYKLKDKPDKTYIIRMTD